MYFIAILLCLVPVVLGFPTGPPVGQPNLCTDMIPTGHNGGVSLATDQDTPPYTITVSATNYTTGDPLTVTITGTGDVQFQGFFIQARRADPAQDNDVAIGTFSSPPATTQLLMCHSVANSAWGHSNNDARSSIVGTWTAPAQDEGPLEFKATIVKGDPNQNYFYVDVKSAPLTFGGSYATQQPNTDMTTVGSGTNAGTNAAGTESPEAPSGAGTESPESPETTPSSGPRHTVSFTLSCVAVLLAAILALRHF